MDVQKVIPQNPKPTHKRYTLLFWVVLGIIIAITLFLAGLIVWIFKTQNLTNATSLIGLIASIVAIVTGPLIFLFTLAKWPERPEPIQKPTNYDAQATPNTPGKYSIQNAGNVQGQVSGDHASVIMNFGTGTPVIQQPSTPPAAWNVPYRRNAFFTGR